MVAIQPEATVKCWGPSLGKTLSLVIHARVQLLRLTPHYNSLRVTICTVSLQLVPLRLAL